MLFWSFVLAFVLSILYYLSPVHNVTQVEDKPLSDAMVATFVNAHQMAKRMTYKSTSDVKTVNKQCDVTDAYGRIIKVDCRDDKGNFIPISVADPTSRTLTFTYAVSVEESPTLWWDINPADIKQMLPALTDADFDDLGIVSQVFCISNDGAEYDEAGRLYRCNTENIYDKNDNLIGCKPTSKPYLTKKCKGQKGNGIGDYLVTYMLPPEDEYIGKELWRSGILRRTKGSHECGVLWKTNDDKTINLSSGEEIEVGARKKYDENSNYILDNSRRFTLSIPKVIGDNIPLDYKEAMSNGYLPFCITPIEDIYRSFKLKCQKGYNHYKTITYNEIVLEDCIEKE